MSQASTLAAGPVERVAENQFVMVWGDLFGRFAVVLLCGLTWTLSGCDKPPTQPTPVARPEPSPTVTQAPSLTGMVTIAGVPSDLAGVPNARLDVVSGTGSGTSVVTNEFGDYLLEAVEGTVTLRVSANGYLSTEVTGTAKAYSRLNIGLTPIGEIPAVQGTYKLTVRAARDCRPEGETGALPPEVRTRTYAAAVQQTGAQLKVTLTGATFKLVATSNAWNEPEIRGDGFMGFAASDRVEFFLEGSDIPDWGAYPQVDETLANGRALVIRGKVSAKPGASIVGTLSGDFVFSGPGGQVSCHSERHEFLLER